MADEVVHSPGTDTTCLLAEFTLPNRPGNEKEALEAVVTAVRGLKLSPARLKRLQAAVTETMLNIAAYGRKYCAALPVLIQVFVSPPEQELPLTGATRSWGFFLVEKMGCAEEATAKKAQHIIEVFLYPARK